MLRGTNLTYTKAYNFRIVLETILLLRPISSADIVLQINLTAQTVSNIVSRLQKRDLIFTIDKLQKQRGEPSSKVMFNPVGAYPIEIYFYWDYLTSILVDLRGKVVSKYFYKVDNREPNKAVHLISDTIKILKKLGPFYNDCQSYH